MVADVSWHSLGIEQGFLRTMGAVSGYHHKGAIVTPRSKLDSGMVWGTSEVECLLNTQSPGFDPQLYKQDWITLKKKNTLGYSHILWK